MYQNLETVIRERKRPKFKSTGEDRIACFLEDSSIKYQYETGVLVQTDDDKSRIWYPDFCLPEFGTYIEYYGMVGDPDYDKGIRVKESVYEKNRMDVIPVYPWMFAKNWQRYIFGEIERSLKDRYRRFRSKLNRSKQGSF